MDLVFHRRDHTATLSVQVKARMSDGAGVGCGQFLANVRVQTFRPRPDLDMLFVAVDIVAGQVMTAWLIPSIAWAATLGEPNRLGRYRFSASMKPDANDRWRPYRLTVNRRLV